MCFGRTQNTQTEPISSRNECDEQKSHLKQDMPDAMFIDLVALRKNSKPLNQSISTLRRYLGKERTPGQAQKSEEAEILLI